jgi:Protein of unknown function (DUF1573)
MKKIILMLLLFPAIAWSQPDLEFTTEKHDFGNVIQGPQLEYTFAFINAGSDELIITEVNTSWGCGAVVASSSHLKAGEKGGITARISTLMKKGLITETVEVVCNDPKRPNVVLTVKATIFENSPPPMQKAPVH